MTFGSQALIWFDLKPYSWILSMTGAAQLHDLDVDTSTQGLLQCKKSRIKRISTHSQTWFYNVAYNILLESSYPKLLKCLDKLLHLEFVGEISKVFQYTHTRHTYQLYMDSMNRPRPTAERLDAFVSRLAPWIWQNFGFPWEYDGYGWIWYDIHCSIHIQVLSTRYI